MSEKKTEKNVKGYIGLFLGLASIVLFLVACFVPMTKLTGFNFDGKMSFYGSTNVTFVWISVLFALAAIVFGFMSRKHKDKKGPRKPGVIIGIIFVILGLIAALFIGLLSTITEYINNDGQSGVIADTLKDDPSQKETIDNLVKALQKAAGVEETGIGDVSSDKKD